MNRCDRYWIINDAELLANYLEDLAGSLLTASDTSTALNNEELAFKSTKVLPWRQSVEYMKRQDRVLGYSHFLTTKRFEDKANLGILESRKYTEKPALFSTATTELAEITREEVVRSEAKAQYAILSDSGFSRISRRPAFSRVSTG